VVAEGVPRQLTEQGVVLVQVVPAVGEDQVGLEGLQGLEGLLEVGVTRGEIGIGEVQERDLGALDTLRELGGARLGLAGAFAGGGEDRPLHPDSRVFGDHA
jgi:hypothetical protein